MSLPHIIPLTKDTYLRPYQQKAKDDIYAAWGEVDDVMFQMPTGTGKTVLFTSIIKDIFEENKRRRRVGKVMIVAHRAELIDQIDRSLTNYNIPHNVYKGPNKDITKDVFVTSIQTITHKKNSHDRALLKQLVRYVIIDEAHHARAKTYKHLWHYFPHSKILGVTATPWRMNHAGFQDLFQRLILSPPPSKFIEQGWLAKYRYYSLKPNSRTQRIINNINEFDEFGDYKESALEQYVDTDHIRAQLLDSYRKLAWGKKGIIYSINRNHSRHIVDKFRNAGLRVYDIDSKTPQKERERLVNRFKKGDIDILVNVNIFSEGFDCPDIEFIQLARPTKSLAMYLQQVGRGLRTTKGKSRCIILDNVGLYNRFGFPDTTRHWQHHFNGTGVDEEEKPKGRETTQSSANVGWFEPDISEGNEQMELIQRFADDEGEEIKEERIFDYTTTKSTKPRNMRLVETTIKLAGKGYKPKGHLMVADRDDEIYDVRIDKYGDATVDKVIVDENSVSRLLVASYKPYTKPHDIIQSGQYQNLLTIRHLAGWCSATDVKNADGTTSICDFEGKETTLNAEFNHLLKLRVENSSKANDCWNCSFDKSQYDIVKDVANNYDIKVHATDGKINHVRYAIKDSDLWRLFESGKKIEILRHDTSLFYIALLEQNGYKLLKYTLDGKANDEFTKNLLPKPYISSLGNSVNLSPTCTKIIEYLKKHPNSMAKDIQAGTGLDKSLINQKLYGELTTKKLVTQTGYSWKIRQ